MKIAIINESFLQPTHISRLNKLGEVTETFEDDCEVVVADMFETKLDREFFAQTKGIKLLAINSTGYDLVDLKAAKSYGVKVANVPGFSTEAVAEQALALMLAVARHVPRANRDVKKAYFEIDPGSSMHRKYLGFELKGKTLGVVGLGKIGTRMAEIGLGLGMEVLAFNRTKAEINGVSQVDLANLLKQSDVVSLHLPIAPGLEKMIGAEQLAMMKSSAVLVNTGRNKLVDTDALYNALKDGRLGGAGLDVIDLPEKNHPILQLENLVLSPHSGFFTEEALSRLADTLVENIEAYANGKSQNIVGAEG